MSPLVFIILYQLLHFIGRPFIQFGGWLRKKKLNLISSLLGKKKKKSGEAGDGDGSVGRGGVNGSGGGGGGGGGERKNSASPSNNDNNNNNNNKRRRRRKRNKTAKANGGIGFATVGNTTTQCQTALSTAATLVARGWKASLQREQHPDSADDWIDLTEEEEEEQQQRKGRKSYHSWQGKRCFCCSTAHKMATGGSFSTKSLIHDRQIRNVIMDLKISRDFFCEIGESFVRFQKTFESWSQKSVWDIQSFGGLLCATPGLLGKVVDFVQSRPPPANDDEMPEMRPTQVYYLSPSRCCYISEKQGTICGTRRK